MADTEETEVKAAEEVKETKEEQPLETEAVETSKDSTDNTQDETAPETQEEASKVTDQETGAQGEDQISDVPNESNQVNDDVKLNDDDVKSNDVVKPSEDIVRSNEDVDNANDNVENVHDKNDNDNAQIVNDNAQIVNDNVNDDTAINGNAQDVSTENIQPDNVVKEDVGGETPKPEQPKDSILTGATVDDQMRPEGEAETAKEQVESAEVLAEETGEKVEGEATPAEESTEVKEDEHGEKVEGEEAAQGEDKPGSEKGESTGGDGEAPITVDGETAAVEDQPPSGEEPPPPTAEEDATEDSIKSPIPQSDTFTEGDRVESPVPQTVGEKLSRGPTPALDDMSRENTQTEMLEPGTPERPGTPEEGDTQQNVQEEEDGTPEPQIDREALIEKYNAALAEREQLKQQNYQLQHKLAEYFRKKKSDDRADYDKNVTDQEQRYLKYMDQLQELQKLAKREKETYKLQINDLEDKCKEKKKKVDEERNRFTGFKQDVALNSLNSRSGKPIPPKDIEQYLINEEKKENEVVNVRLENIKSKNKLKKKEQQLKSKEELAEGLHLIDFEQLKIENQTYNEKIEERNEELLKLRKKITSTVQVLTHLKEKLQFVQAENQVQKKNLQDVEALVGQKRDILSRTKQARDSLRIDNHKLRQNCGLLGNEPLLRDFEERKDEGDDLKMKLEELRSVHAELALNCNQVRRKIEQARMGQA